MPPSDTATVAEAPTKYVPPPKPDAPLADVAAILSAGNPMLLRNENVRFDFRTDRTTGTRRPSIWLTVAVPTWEAIVAKCNDPDPVVAGKFRNFVLDLVQEQVVNAAKQQVGDEDKPVNSQEELDLKSLDWEYIVNQPASTRRGNGISKEVWEAFAEDYLKHMPELTGKNKDRIATQVKLFTGKFSAVKTQKQVIGKLLSELEIYVARVPSAEEYSDVIEYLVKKGSDLLNMTEESVLNSI